MRTNPNIGRCQLLACWALLAARPGGVLDSALRASTAVHARTMRRYLEAFKALDLVEGLTLTGEAIRGTGGGRWGNDVRWRIRLVEGPQ